MILLHIGTPKTGTTHLQVMAEFNRENLSRSGVKIARSGALPTLLPDTLGRLFAGVCHHPVAWAIQQRADVALLQSAAEIAAELRAEAEASPTLLLTSECFYWELRHADELRHLCEMLPSETSVIIGVRNRWQFVESMYSQAVIDHKFGGSIESFLEENTSHFDVGSVIHEWETLVAPVFPYVYSESMLSLDEMLKSVNIKCSTVPVMAKFNVSVPRVILPIMRLIRNPDISVPGLIDSLQSNMAAMPPCRLLSCEQMDRLDEACHEGDKRLDVLGILEPVKDRTEYQKLPHFRDISLGDLFNRDW